MGGRIFRRLWEEHMNTGETPALPETCSHLGDAEQTLRETTEQQLSTMLTIRGLLAFINLVLYCVICLLVTIFCIQDERLVPWLLDGVLHKTVENFTYIGYGSDLIWYYEES